MNGETYKVGQSMGGVFGWVLENRLEMLEKGAGHKYLKRTPYIDSKGKRRYKYDYKMRGSRAHGHEDDQIQGASFYHQSDGKDGHIRVLAVHDDGTVSIRHDETKKEERVSRKELSQRLNVSHKESFDEFVDDGKGSEEDGTKTEKKEPSPKAQSKQVAKVAAKGFKRLPVGSKLTLPSGSKWVRVKKGWQHSSGKVLSSKNFYEHMADVEAGADKGARVTFGKLFLEAFLAFVEGALPGRDPKWRMKFWDKQKRKGAVISEKESLDRLGALDQSEETEEETGTSDSDGKEVDETSKTHSGEESNGEESNGEESNGEGKEKSDEDEDESGESSEKASERQPNTKQKEDEEKQDDTSSSNKSERNKPEQSKQNGPNRSRKERRKSQRRARKTQRSQQKRRKRSRKRTRSKQRLSKGGAFGWALGKTLDQAFEEAPLSVGVFEESALSRIADEHINASLLNRPDWDPRKQGKSAGVFVRLPGPLAHQFPSLGAHDTSPCHMTFLYVGDVPKERHALFYDTVERVLREYDPQECDLGDVECFEKDDIDIYYCAVYAPLVLHQVRARLIEKLERLGFDLSSVYREWVPHVTLEYAQKGEVYSGPVPSGSFDANRFEIWGMPRATAVDLASAKAQRDILQGRARSPFKAQSSSVTSVFHKAILGAMDGALHSAERLHEKAWDETEESVLDEIVVLGGGQAGGVFSQSFQKSLMSQSNVLVLNEAQHLHLQDVLRKGKGPFKYIRKIPYLVRNGVMAYRYIYDRIKSRKNTTRTKSKEQEVGIKPKGTSADLMGSRRRRRSERGKKKDPVEEVHQASIALKPSPKPSSKDASQVVRRALEVFGVLWDHVLRRLPEARRYQSAYDALQKDVSPENADRVIRSYKAMTQALSDTDRLEHKLGHLKRAKALLSAEVLNSLVGKGSWLKSSVWSPHQIHAGISTDPNRLKSTDTVVSSLATQDLVDGIETHNAKLLKTVRLQGRPEWLFESSPDESVQHWLGVYGVQDSGSHSSAHLPVDLERLRQSGIDLSRSLDGFKYAPLSVVLAYLPKTPQDMFKIEHKRRLDTYMPIINRMKAALPNVLGETNRRIEAQDAADLMGSFEQGVGENKDRKEPTKDDIKWRWLQEFQGVLKEHFATNLQAQPYTPANPENVASRSTWEEITLKTEVLGGEVDEKTKEYDFGSDPKRLKDLFTLIHKDLVPETYGLHTVENRWRSRVSGEKVYCSNKKGVGTFWHEFAHLLETHNAEISDACAMLVTTRANGRKAGLLGDGYESNERAYPGFPYSAYSGKFYGDTAGTEVFSTGIEHMWSDPKGFSKKDSEHFALVVAALTGQMKD